MKKTQKPLVKKFRDEMPRHRKTMQKYFGIKAIAIPKVEQVAENVIRIEWYNPITDSEYYLKVLYATFENDNLIVLEEEKNLLEKSEELIQDKFKEIERLEKETERIEKEIKEFEQNYLQKYVDSI